MNKHPTKETSISKTNSLIDSRQKGEKKLELINTLVNKIAIKINENIEWLHSQVFHDILSLSRDQQEIEEFQDNKNEHSNKIFIYDEYINEKIIDGYISNILMNHKLGWNHSSFDDLNRKQQDQDAYLCTPFEMVDGVVECKRCSSKKVHSVSVQTRAADEPMTTVSVCTICKYKWSQNG